MNKGLDSNCLGIQRQMRFSVLKEHFELVSDPAFSSVSETEFPHCNWAPFENLSCYESPAKEYFRSKKTTIKGHPV